jgi:signal recognition particle subunit SRP54
MGLPPGFTPPGGMGGGGPDMARLKALGGGKLPQPGAAPGAGGGLSGLPGLGGGFPGLPGFKKK